MKESEANIFSCISDTYMSASEAADLADYICAESSKEILIKIREEAQAGEYSLLVDELTPQQHKHLISLGYGVIYPGEIVGSISNKIHIIWKD